MDRLDKVEQDLLISSNISNFISKVIQKRELLPIALRCKAFFKPKIEEDRFTTSLGTKLTISFIAEKFGFIISTDQATNWAILMTVIKGSDLKDKENMVENLKFLLKNKVISNPN